jgi:hypothetical protein
MHIFSNEQLYFIEGSIMHYLSDAFSTNGRAKIRPSLPGYENWEYYMGRGNEKA